MVLFDPVPAIAALRHYRGRADDKGNSLVWRNPGNRGETDEYGFRDSFKIGRAHV